MHTEDPEVTAAVEELTQRLMAMDRVGTRSLVQRLVGEWTPQQVADRVIVRTLEKLGDRWDAGDVALAQVYMGARICESLADDLFPEGAQFRPARPRIGIATLIDYHALGRRMVQLSLRSGGWAPTDLGRGEVDELADRVVEAGIELLFVSVLLLPSALQVKDLVEALRKRGSSAAVIAGGAPFRFDEELWREVGADGFGRSASDALTIAERISGEAAA